MLKEMQESQRMQAVILFTRERESHARTSHLVSHFLKQRESSLASFQNERGQFSIAWGE